MTNTFTWQLSPVELYHSDKNGFKLGDGYLFDNACAKKLCTEMDVHLRGVININNFDINSEKSLIIRYVYNNNQGLCLFTSNVEYGITPIALIDKESNLSIDSIDFRDGYNSIKDTFRPSKEEIFRLFAASQEAFDELNYPQDRSAFKVLTTNIYHQVATEEFYIEDDAYDYLNDMQIEANNPNEKILKLEIVKVKGCIHFDKQPDNNPEAVTPSI